MKHAIETFDDACKALGLDPQTAVPVVSGMPEKHQKAIIAHAKLVIVAEALNEGWTPDWNNGQWDKYYPWFDFETPKGSWSRGFSFLGFAFVRAFSFVGSRLCFKSGELAEYARTQFIELYREYMIIE